MHATVAKSITLTTLFGITLQGLLEGVQVLAVVVRFRFNVEIPLGGVARISVAVHTQGCEVIVPKT